METIIAIAMLAFSLFGPGWSSEHKAFWEWQLGHKLEGYQEHRLSRNWNPYGGGPLLGDSGNRDPSNLDNTPEIVGCYCEYNLETGSSWCDCPATVTLP